MRKMPFCKFNIQVFPLAGDGVQQSIVAHNFPKYISKTAEFEPEMPTV